MLSRSDARVLIFLLLFYFIFIISVFDWCIQSRPSLHLQMDRQFQVGKTVSDIFLDDEGGRGGDRHIGFCVMWTMWFCFFSSSFIDTDKYEMETKHRISLFIFFPLENLILYLTVQCTCFRFLPEDIFVSKYFHISLLLLHIITLAFCSR